MVVSASNVVEIIPSTRVTCDPLYTELGQIDRMQKYGGFLAEQSKKITENILRLPKYLAYIRNQKVKAQSLCISLYI